jgi:hypothetical protein
MPRVLARGPLNVLSPNVMKKRHEIYMKQQLPFLMSENFFRKRTGLSGGVVTTYVINSVTRQDILEHWSQIGNFPKNVKLRTQGNWTDCIPFWSCSMCIMLQQNLSLLVPCFIAAICACVCVCVCTHWQSLNGGGKNCLTKQYITFLEGSVKLTYFCRKNMAEIL